jgi:hypothetical protein
MGGHTVTPECPYCRTPSALVTGREVYPHRRDLHELPFYQCAPCDARVGCHPGTTRALGRLANAELRTLRSAAHAAFDPIWKTGKMSRTSAYKWLATQLQSPNGIVHIGEMNEAECQQVIEVCNP